MLASRQTRIDLAKRRINNILRKHTIATLRTLEQKISDAGPSNQRVDPHILTQSIHQLEKERRLTHQRLSNVPWFHLTNTDPETINSRLQILEPIHTATVGSAFVKRLGQSLEIAIYKALANQKAMPF